MWGCWVCFVGFFFFGTVTHFLQSNLAVMCQLTLTSQSDFIQTLENSSAQLFWFWVYPLVEEGWQPPQLVLASAPSFFFFPRKSYCWLYLKISQKCFLLILVIIKLEDLELVLLALSLYINVPVSFRV